MLFLFLVCTSYFLFLKIHHLLKCNTFHQIHVEVEYPLRRVLRPIHLQQVYSYQESIDFITRIYREQSFEQINKYDDLLKLKLTLKETIDVSKERKGIEEDVSNPLVVNSIIKRGFLGHLPDQEYFHDYLIPLSSSMEITKEVKEGGISKWNKFINDRGNVNATN